VRDAIVYWLGTTEDEVHFIDAVVGAYDGLANVRREYRIRDGRTEYKVFVGPGMEGEFLELVGRLGHVAGILSLERDESGESDSVADATGDRGDGFRH
jgi:hypothetical protein